jgi:hypothetical protein|tara:strand:- start:294 stop:440 length:147 start_codon:yes stop_codon:yes gene_type:complete
MVFTRLQILSIAEQMGLFPDIAAIDYEYTADTNEPIRFELIWNEEVEK